jgi:hypothetical protein
VSVPRVLVAGDLRPYTRTHQRLQALRALGVHVVGVSTSPPGASASGTERVPLLDRVRHRLGIPRDTVDANRAVARMLDAEPFDVLWIEKALTLRPGLLAHAREKRGLQLVFLSEDDMFRRHNQSRYFRAGLSYYDLVVTTKSQNLRAEELPALGARNVLFLAKTFDPGFHRPVAIDKRTRARLGAAVGFVGTFEEERALAMEHLAKSDIVVRIWGNGWLAWRGRHRNLHVEGRPVVGEDYVRTLCATDVNLGFLRRLNGDLHTDRTVEIPACGAFLLSERTEEQAQLFAEGVEADYFEGHTELLEKVQRHLADPLRREEIARAGHSRALASGYDHNTALRRIFAELGLQLPAAPSE